MVRAFSAAPQLREALGTADVFVLPTRQDTYAAVVHEAACLGLPMLVSRHAGAADALVRDGENGFVVDPADARDFAQRMRFLLDARLRLRMGAVSREVGEEFSAHRRGAALWHWMRETFLEPAEVRSTMNAGAACVMFAPVLKTEGWLSIDLQQADILRALGATRPDLPVVVLKPEERLSRLPFGRRFSREVLYPWLIVRTGRSLSRRGLRPLLHVADHSYGHLCRWWKPCVVNCNDLTHFVRPEISGLSLSMWRRRVQTMCHARRILTISDHLAGEVRSHLHVRPGQVTGLAGGIETDVFKPMAREEAARRGARGGTASPPGRDSWSTSVPMCGAKIFRRSCAPSRSCARGGGS